MNRCFTFLPICIFMLSACGAGKYCLQDQEYQSAESAAPLKTVDGLQLPRSPAALVLPPAPTDPVPYGTRNAAGGAVCLDQPPRLGPPTPAKASKPTS